MQPIGIKVFGDGGEVLWATLIPFDDDVSTASAFQTIANVVNSKVGEEWARVEITRATKQ